jgi:regulatory protein
MDAYTTALTLLSRRELSTAQLRDRLARRRFPAGEIDEVIARLTADRTLDDARVAVASARLETAVRRRGRRRVLQRVRQLGINEDTARAAVDEAFGDVDEAALLDEALARRLRGRTAGALDAKALARVVRGLVAQGFDAGQVYARLRRMGGTAPADSADEEGDERGG